MVTTLLLLLLLVLSGMNLYAAAFLLPVGVMFYTAQGGLKASYVASWANTGAAQIAIIYNKLISIYVKKDIHIATTFLLSADLLVPTFSRVPLLHHARRHQHHHVQCLSMLLALLKPPGILLQE